MKTLEFSERQLTWLLLALQHYEAELEASFFTEEDAALEDLLILQDLRRKVEAARRETPLASDEGKG